MGGLGYGGEASGYKGGAVQEEERSSGGRRSDGQRREYTLIEVVTGRPTEQWYELEDVVEEFGLRAWDCRAGLVR
ncbi:uncharacterized protein A4U43_C10F11650 [Asparagus officinalis]|uniref:Uncharacterized protein n=1 Tax=Asparagus officinalis TaxID=4686 RepID=A0A5P1E5F6_ASPOF|nr:uncharacterized protein A4U43_C10F11650 [Asparagus officinalis]